MVDFSDLQCPHCKEAHPALEKLMAENKNVRLVFQSFPLPMHDWAAKAAAYADCVSRSSNDAFWKFIAECLRAQSDITAANADEKLTGLADGAGVKGADIAACAAKPETASRVEKSQALGQVLECEQHADALHQRPAECPASLTRCSRNWWTSPPKMVPSCEVNCGTQLSDIRGD